MSNQNLSRSDKIVNEDGTPTQYFMRLLLTRANLLSDFEGAVQDALDDVEANKADSSRQIIADAPITGGGDLTADRHIGHANSGVTADTYGDATHVPQIAVDAKGHITGVTEVAISGGGGGGGANWWFQPPTTATFPNSFGTGFVATDDADEGLLMYQPGGNLISGVSKAITPGTNWEVIARFDFMLIARSGGNCRVGLTTHNAAENLFLDWTADTRRIASTVAWTNTGYNGFQNNFDFAVPPYWFRLTYDAATGIMSHYVSGSGKQWVLVTTTNAKSYYGGVDPAYIGPVIVNEGSAYQVEASCVYWSDTL